MMEPSIHSIPAAMKMILMNYTTKRLAALLRLVPAPTRSTPARRPSVPPAADLIRIPAYMRRRRLGGRVPNTSAQRPHVNRSTTITARHR